MVIPAHSEVMARYLSPVLTMTGASGDYQVSAQSHHSVPQGAGGAGQYPAAPADFGQCLLASGEEGPLVSTGMLGIRRRWRCLPR